MERVVYLYLLASDLRQVALQGLRAMSSCRLQASRWQGKGRWGPGRGSPLPSSLGAPNQCSRTPPDAALKPPLVNLPLMACCTPFPSTLHSRRKELLTLWTGFGSQGWEVKRCETRTCFWVVMFLLAHFSERRHLFKNSALLQGTLAPLFSFLIVF